MVRYVGVCKTGAGVYTGVFPPGYKDPFKGVVIFVKIHQ